MRENGIQGCPVRPRRGGELWYVAAPTDLLRREFRVSTLDSAWMGDMKEIATSEGVLRLAAIEDACSRAIVGYAFGVVANTSLTLRALAMARRRRNPKMGLICHSDRGSQYRSRRYETAVERMGGKSSYSAVGVPHDNACIESFFATLQREVLDDAYYRTRAQAKSAVLKFISYYNTERLHSTLGYRTPTEVQEARAA
jgi:putative transposase